MSDHVEMKRTATARIHISGMDRERLGNERADLLEYTLNYFDQQLADRDRELQQAAAENAVMREAATKLRDKGDHADFCEWDQVDENDGCPISCSCGHNDVIAALSTPSPRAAQILAALDAARLAYAVPNPTATGADLEALTDLGRKLAALTVRADDGGRNE